MSFLHFKFKLFSLGKNSKYMSILSKVFSAGAGDLIKKVGLIIMNYEYSCGNEIFTLMKI